MTESAGATDPATEATTDSAVERSLRAGRLVVAAGLALLALARRDDTTIALGIGACAVAVALTARFESVAVRLLGRIRPASVVTVGVDVGAVLLSFGLAGITFADPPAALLALPLTHAAYRHGAAGWIAATSAVALASCLHLAATWTGRMAALLEWSVGMAIVVGLSGPTAHFVDRVVRRSTSARREDERRVTRAAALITATSQGVASIVDGDRRRDLALVLAVESLDDCSATIRRAGDTGRHGRGDLRVDLDGGRTLDVTFGPDAGVDPGRAADHPAETGGLPVDGLHRDDVISAIHVLADARTRCALLPDDLPHHVAPDLGDRTSFEAWLARAPLPDRDAGTGRPCEPEWVADASDDVHHGPDDHMSIVPVVIGADGFLPGSMDSPEAAAALVDRLRTVDGVRAVARLDATTSVVAVDRGRAEPLEVARAVAAAFAMPSAWDVRVALGIGVGPSPTASQGPVDPGAWIDEAVAALGQDRLLRDDRFDEFLARLEPARRGEAPV